MLGSFQRSSLRLEVEASAEQIEAALTRPDYFQQWLWPQQFTGELSFQLAPGSRFQGLLGPITIHHTVDSVHANRLCLILSQGIDGVHQWTWDDGWVQSSLQGISVLPLSLGHTITLLRLRNFLRESGGDRPSP